MTTPGAAGGKSRDWPCTWPALIAWLLADWGRTFRLIVVLTTVALLGGHAGGVVIDDLVHLIK